MRAARWAGNIIGVVFLIVIGIAEVVEARRKANKA